MTALISSRNVPTWTGFSPLAKIRHCHLRILECQLIRHVPGREPRGARSRAFGLLPVFCRVSRFIYFTFLSLRSSIRLTNIRVGYTNALPFRSWITVTQRDRLRQRLSAWIINAIWSCRDAILSSIISWRTQALASQIGRDLISFTDSEVEMYSGNIDGFRLCVI